MFAAFRAATTSATGSQRPHISPPLRLTAIHCRHGRHPHTWYDQCSQRFRRGIAAPDATASAMPRESPHHNPPPVRRCDAHATTPGTEDAAKLVPPHLSSNPSCCPRLTDRLALLGLARFDTRFLESRNHSHNHPLSSLYRHSFGSCCAIPAFLIQERFFSCAVNRPDSPNPALAHHHERDPFSQSIIRPIRIVCILDSHAKRFCSLCDGDECQSECAISSDPGPARGRPSHPSFYLTHLRFPWDSANQNPMTFMARPVSIPAPVGPGSHSGPAPMDLNETHPLPVCSGAESNRAPLPGPSRSCSVASGYGLFLIMRKAFIAS